MINIDNEYHLRAICEKRNIKRFYKIYTCRNLLGEYEAITSFGRIGTKGRIKIFRFNDRSELNVHVSLALKKRLNSKNRIGINYQIN
jgi:predicted DNA-binding WGR domain protein